MPPVFKVDTDAQVLSEVPDAFNSGQMVFNLQCSEFYFRSLGLQRITVVEHRICHITKAIGYSMGMRCRDLLLILSNINHFDMCAFVNPFHSSHCTTFHKCSVKVKLSPCLVSYSAVEGFVKACGQPLFYFS